MKKEIHKLLLEDIMIILSKVLNVSHEVLDLEKPISDLGLDSLMATTVVEYIQEKFDIDFPPTLIYEFLTPMELIDHIINTYEKELEAVYIRPKDRRPEKETIEIPSSSPDVIIEDEFESIWNKLEEGEHYPVSEETISDHRHIIIKSHNNRLSCHTFGKGVPLLIIGGLGCSFLIWKSFIEKLRNKRRLIVFDLPRHEKTRLDPMNLSSLLEALKTLIQELNNNLPIEILGYSLGGVIAMHFAISHPDNVKSLILLSTALEWKKEANLWNRAVEEFQHLGSIKDKHQLLPYASKNNIEVYSNLFSKSSLEKQLKKINVPTLVIAGEEDHYIEKERSKVILKHIKGAKFFAIPHAGHYSMISHIDELINLM